MQHAVLPDPAALKTAVSACSLQRGGTSQKGCGSVPRTARPWVSPTASYRPDSAGNVCHEGKRHVVRIPVEVVYPGRGLFGAARGASSRGEPTGAAWPTETPRSPRRSPAHGSRAERASAWGCSLPRPKPMSQCYDLRTHPQAATGGIFNGRLDPRGSSHRYLRNSRDPLSHSARRPSFHPRMDSLETPA